MSGAVPQRNKKAEHRLRIVQTTDLHMCLIPFDYDAMCPAPDRSLLQLRSLIEDLRAEDIPTLLCDTGDFMQGNAMADIAAEGSSDHPMIAAFNDMGYDAVVPGNHDFDYGLAPVRTALANLDCPALAANLHVANDAPLTVPYTIIPVETSDGPIRVGLLGLTSEHTARLAVASGSSAVTASSALQAAKYTLPGMKDAGADLIVALCHFGILPENPDENVAAAIAALHEVDAVMAGHTHDVFPGPDLPKTDTIDPVGGRVHGKPAVMAGAFGQRIGVLDFELRKDVTGWSIASATSRTLPAPTNPVPPPLSRPGIMALHEATLEHMQTEVAHTEVPINTHFNMLAADMGQQILAQARIEAVTQALEGTRHAKLPVLGSAAPFRAGNKGAPLAFLDVRPGPLSRGDVIGIFPFQDAVVGQRTTGGTIQLCLEEAARRFNRIASGGPAQTLVDPTFAPYHFASFFGLTYSIDPSRPKGQRIGDLHYRGTPVKASDEFVVATSPHHLAGDSTSASADLLVVMEQKTQEAVLNYLRSQGTVSLQATPVWRFAPLANTEVDILTSPAAQASEAPYPATDLGLTDDGQRRIRVSLN